MDRRRPDGDVRLRPSLSRLGEREGGTVRPEEAVATYTAALDGFAAAGATAFANTCGTKRKG